MSNFTQCELLSKILHKIGMGIYGLELRWWCKLDIFWLENVMNRHQNEVSSIFSSCIPSLSQSIEWGLWANSKHDCEIIETWTTTPTITIITVNYLKLPIKFILIKMVFWMKCEHCKLHIDRNLNIHSAHRIHRKLILQKALISSIYNWNSIKKPTVTGNVSVRL